MTQLTKILQKELRGKKLVRAGEMACKFSIKNHFLYT